MSRSGEPRDSIDLPPMVQSVLRGEVDQVDDQHVDPVDLAEYLDGVLAANARETLEAHLAICASCREMASAAADLAGDAAAAPQPERPGALFPAPGEARIPRRSPAEKQIPEKTPVPRRWLVAASFVVAVLGIALFQSLSPRSSEALAGLGVSSGVVTNADPELIGLAVRAADGRWPDPVDLDGFGTPGGDAALRAGELMTGPEPLAPRWSAVDDTRPAFRWRWIGEEAPDGYEVLVVDLEENPVVFLDADADAVGAPGGASGKSGSSAIGSDARWLARMPESAPALVRGETYAWKVNVQHAGEWLASVYVPFRVLSEDASAKLSAELDQVGEVPFLRAVVLASHGLDARALEALAATPTRPADRQTMARELLVHKRLSDAAVAAEIARYESP